MQTVSRAVKEDLETPVQYEVSFIRNARGRIITDRRFNTASLMAIYLGKDAITSRAMTWNPDDPNTLEMNLPGQTQHAWIQSSNDIANSVDIGMVKTACACASDLIKAGNC